MTPRRPLPTSGIPATTPGPARVAATSPAPVAAARPTPRAPAADGRRGPLSDARRQAAQWCRRYRAGGEGSVAARRRHGVLTRAQELTLIENMRDHFPDQLNLTGPLWSRQNVAALTERLHNISLSPAAAARFLRTWGLATREPVDRACPLCAASVVRWQAEVYPTISRAAQKQRAEVYWAGKTRLHGVAPTTEVVAAISARGWVRFMVTTGPELPRDFLARLLPASGRVHVVADGSWSCAELPRRVPDGVLLHALPCCERRR